MNRSLSLGIVVGAALSSGFKSTFGSAERSTLQLGKAIRDTDSKLRSIRGIRDVEAQLQKLRAQQTQTGGTSTALAKEIKSTEKELLSAQKAAQKYGIALDKLSDEEQRLTKEQNKNKRRQLGSKVGGAIGGGLSTAARVGGMGLAAGAGIAGSILEYGKKRSDETEALVNTANKLGFTTQAYQELQLGAAAAGVDQEKFNASTEKMVGNLAQVAATGKGSAAPALAALGLNAEKLAQMQPDQQMAAISDALAGVADAGDRVRLSKGIFGKGGASMLTILSDGSGALEKMRDQVRKTGAVLSDSQINDGLKLDDALDRAELSMKGLTNTLGAALVPGLTAVIEKTNLFATEHGPQFQAMGTVLSATFSGVATVLGGVFSVMESIGTSIGETLGWIESKTGVISGIANLLGPHDAANTATSANPSSTTPLAAPQDVFPPIPKPTLGGGSKSVKTTVNAPITINQQAGQNGADVADAVARKLREREAIAKRGALYDDEDTD